ncbi:MAG: cytochrome c oxidase assembly protein [Pseudomonadota bacterium]|nr:cytochrome c oxidase assembly protein [Pseudomonadota bacterium]
MNEYVPFCGTPPLPSDLWSRWTFDPVLLAGLAVALAAILWRTGPGTRPMPLVGWALVAILFVSPLCAASMALFSARVAQHLLLTLVAAPLLAPLLVRFTPPPALAATLFGCLFWLWHVPGPYALTLQSDIAYWVMHLSLLGSATYLWAGLASSVSQSPFLVALATAGTGAQMTLLAVLLILSSRLWHPWHELTTAPYGLSALGDQALAGGLMWVAGGLIFVALVGGLTFRFIRQPSQSI